MNFINLFAQVAPVFDTGSKSKATVDAAELAKQIGPVWFFAIVCLVIMVLVIAGLGWLAYKFGGKCIDRIDKFLESTEAIAKGLDANTKVCVASADNIANLCSAGHSFANAVEKIGKEMGADVRAECDKIHEKLQTIASA